MPDVLELVDSRRIGPGSAGIVRAIEELVGEGALAPDTRLPPIRSVARSLGVSPTTVAAAWRALVAGGVIETRGRRGSFVAGRRGGRSWLSGPPARHPVDLSTGTPDPDLLPDISDFFGSFARLPAEASSYLGPVVLPELEELVRASLPFRPDAVTVVDGALDAVDRLMAGHVRRGSTVLVEDPAFPPLAELAEVHGGRIVPLATDPHGIEPGSLVDGLKTRPSMMVLQPRANNPTGVSTPPERIAELAEALGDADLLVVEDDSCGDVAAAPPASLASHLPDRVVHVRSYSKSHGPDLRIAAVCGPAGAVDPLVERRRLGPIWTPRILQQVLAGMLGDQVAIAAVRTARDTYTRRRNRMVEALARHGVETHGNDGFNVWVPVHDERDALISLAAGGVGVAPGGPFQLAARRPHVRVTVSHPLDDVEAVAGLLAAAGAPGDRRPSILV